MNRLLLLRPVSRAIRVKGNAQSTRNIARAFSTTPCQKLRSTTPVNKKITKGMSVVDSDLLDGNFEQLAEGEPLEPPAPELRSSVIHSAKKEVQKEQQPQAKIPIEDEAIPPELLPKMSTEPIDIEEYYGSWFSYETRVALGESGLDRYAFVCAILDTPYFQAMLNNLSPTLKDEFENRFLAFEVSEKDDDSGLIPVLEFFLRGGVQLLPPTPENVEAGDCFRLVKPSVAQKSLDTAPMGQWQMKGKEARNYITEPIPFPDLMQPDALLDPRDVITFPSSRTNKFENQVVVRNHHSVFHQMPEDARDPLLDLENDVEVEEDEGGDSIISSVPISSEYYKNLYHSILMYRPVVQQTGKGKIRRVSYTVLVGDGKGLVGVGEGKHANNQTALKAARIAAVKNMDWVERFEQRTIWTEMRSKFGATELILRPRPVGFGLRCNPFLHQILRAAGMKDISAKVWGSRNKLNVIKAAIRMLHAGHAPTAMGDGIGGKGKKMSRGRGVRGKAEVERARGRKLISLRY